MEEDFMKKNWKWSPEELEKLTLHELADLMANIVMVLRRMPDVPVSDLVARPTEDASELVTRLRHENTNREPGVLPDWVE
jgi:hypothetical protein